MDDSDIDVARRSDDSNPDLFARGYAGGLDARLRAVETSLVFLWLVIAYVSWRTWRKDDA